MATQNAEPGVSQRVPLVVQIGISGTRLVVPQDLQSSVVQESYRAALQAEIRAYLEQLPRRLGGWDQHFPCAVSQLAIGVDTLALRATCELGWMHRIVLPRFPEEYFSATAEDGTPDFPGATREECEGLLHAPNVIDFDVVSTAAKRNDRFAEVNHHMARACDLLVFVVGEGSVGGPGGTGDLVERAQNRGMPYVLLRVRKEADGRLWLDAAEDELGAFEAPKAPHELDHAGEAAAGLCGVGCSAEELRSCLRKVAEKTANRLRDGYLVNVRVVLVTHVAATALAVAAILLAGKDPVAWKLHIKAILLIELVVLSFGFWRHHSLHKEHITASWAMCRLIEQVVDSATAMKGIPHSLRHFFSLPMPRSLRPVLRTLNVLHLQEVSRWEGNRPSIKQYLNGRVASQADYHGDVLKKSGEKLQRMVLVFYSFSGLAILMTATKLGKKLFGSPKSKVPGEGHSEGAGLADLASHSDLFSDTCGFLAVWSPVVAVAALTWAVASDLKARQATGREMQGFLKRFLDRNQHLEDGPIFHGVALETEARILGESANWYARRAFVD